MNTKTAKIFIHSLVLSKLDFQSTLYYNLPKHKLRKLQIIQNKCVRFIYKIAKFSRQHITPLLHELKWLPIKARIEMKATKTAHTAFHNSTPIYLNKLVSKRLESKYSLRNASTCYLHVPYSKSKFGDRAFSNYAPKLLNALPYNLNNIHTKCLQKSRLFEYYFKKSYTDKNNINEVYKVT